MDNQTEIVDVFPEMEHESVDAALREHHLSQIVRPESRAMYDRTLKQCLDREGGLLPTDQDMIFDLCQAEDIKAELQEDIRKRGVVVETRNGRQIFRKENPSMARMCRYTELQRKIRADLKITPAKRAAADSQELEEEADAFEDF